MKKRRIPVFALLLTPFLLLLSAWVHAEQVESFGKWQTIDFGVTGQWKIIQEEDGLYVVLDEQFTTKNGPDLHILLSPQPVSALTHSNTAEGALDVGLLKSADNSALFQKMKGAQRLKIAEGTDLQKYQSIAIHCVKYSHVWAAGSLR